MGDLSNVSTGSAILVSLAVGAIGLLAAWLGNSRRLMGRIDELNAIMFKLNDDHLKCEQGRGADRLRIKDLESDLSHAQHRIAALESRTGIANAPPAVGAIITDTVGLIAEFSPSMTVVLGYTPEDMRGRQLSSIIDPDLMGEFTAGWDVLIASPYDPRKVIYTYLIDKSGRKVPVTLNLRKWSGEYEIVTVFITVRASAGSIGGGDTKTVPKLTTNNPSPKS